MKTILIIEDNNEIRENLEELLELKGYQTMTSPDGECGISKAQEGKPDLILCDVAMPKKNGYEVFEAMKSSSITSKIPFVFVTASAQERDIAMGKMVGAEAYITKPFEVDNLLSIIGSILD